MRYHILRFDIWLCLALSFLVSLGTVKIVEGILPKKYEDYVQEHIVEDGNIGGKAGEDVYRAQNVEDLLNNETFTIISPGIEYCNKGAGYYDNFYMYSVTLPSGERIADSMYSGDSILPVGRIVYEDLTSNEYFINQIEYSEELSRKDFYIDMIGNGGKLSKEDYTETPILITQLLTIFIMFPIFHTIGSKLGIFPTFFSFKKKKEAEWK